VTKPKLVLGTSPGVLEGIIEVVATGHRGLCWLWSLLSATRLKSHEVARCVHALWQPITANNHLNETGLWGSSRRNDSFLSRLLSPKRPSCVAQVVIYLYDVAQTSV